MKIIQIIPMPNNFEWQGALLGLGDDGVLYILGNGNVWEVHTTCEIKEQSK